MKRLFILLSVFGVFISSFAQNVGNNNVLINHDRVWVATSFFLGDHVAKYMKFAESKDFNGITYTRVSTIKKVRWESTDPTDIIIEENIDETEAWMREENGKVYLLLDGWQNYVESESTDNLSEGLLYDFNAEQGSSYEGISLSRIYEDREGKYFEGRNYVSSVSKETVAEDEVKCQHIIFRPNLEEYVDNPGPTYPIVEGIGIVEYGCLFYVESFYHTSGFYSYNNFLCLMDTNGKILYPADFKDELPGGGLPSVKLHGVETDLISYKDKMVSAHGFIISLYDLTGRLVSKNKDYLSLECITEGTYIIRTTDGITSKSIIIRVD